MSEYRYCPFCASPLQPFEDEERIRLRCPACGWIHYRNPTDGVAVALVEESRLLLGERRDGGWCIPCGHVEWDEFIEQAARREFLEETGLRVTLDRLLAVHSNFHNPIQHTVGVWFSGKRQSGLLRSGGDLLRLAFFAFQALPELKFPTDELVVASLLTEH